MEAGSDASTKRPLLEEAEADAVLPSVEGANARTARARRRAGPSVGEEQDELLQQDHQQNNGQPEATVVIEMESFAAQALPEESPADTAEGNEVGRGSGTGDRHCFICLQDGDKEHPLIPCCSTCYARTHLHCWREWRKNQRVTAVRSRLLGLRTQTNHWLRCTICKSGTAVLAGEEGGLEWMNDLLCGGEGGPARTPFIGAPRPQDDSDEDSDAIFEDLVDMRTCIVFVVYLVVLVIVLLVACLLLVMPWKFYAGDVVLCCIIALYELSVLQIVVLTVSRRRAAVVAAAAETGSSFGPATSNQSNPATRNQSNPERQIPNAPVSTEGQASAPSPIDNV